jgi:hypothetical protein
MPATVINLIVKLIAGAIGGNAVGATMKDIDLGALAGEAGGGAGAIVTAIAGAVLNNMAGAKQSAPT